MKLILREHVEHLGERGDEVTVARGYARNYLLPKKLAFEATPGNRIQVEHQRRVWAEREAKEVQEAQAMADQLGALDLSITMKAGESGTLYGSVTNADVAALLSTKKFEIDRKRILLPQPIKAVGEYEIPVRLHPKVRAQLQVAVVAEAKAE